MHSRSFEITMRNEIDFTIESIMEIWLELLSRTLNWHKNMTEELKWKMNKYQTLKLKFMIKHFSQLQKIHFCGKSKWELALRNNHVYLWSTNLTRWKENIMLCWSSLLVVSTMFQIQSMLKLSKKLMFEMLFEVLKPSFQTKLQRSTNKKLHICSRTNKRNFRFMRSNGLSYFRILIKETLEKLQTLTEKSKEFLFEWSLERIKRKILQRKTNQVIWDLQPNYKLMPDKQQEKTDSSRNTSLDFFTNGFHSKTWSLITSFQTLIQFENLLFQKI